MATFKGIKLPDGTTYFPEGSGSAIDTVSVSVDNNTGVPSATGSVSNGVLTLDFQNLKGETPTIAIQDGYWYVNGENTGQQAQGQQGVGIESIEKTSTQGNVDTYTITFTNQTTTTYTVTNGTNGATPNIQIGDVTTLQPDQQATASITGTPENPLLNLGIPQGQAGGEGEWTYLYDEILSEEIAVFTNDGLDFQEIEAYIVLNTAYENATNLYFTSGYNNMYTNPRIQNSINANFIGIIYNKMEVVTKNLWIGYGSKPSNFSMTNGDGLITLFSNKILNAEIDLPNITAFTIQVNNPLPAGTRVIVRGR